jgi:hypothetical protein
MNGVQCRRQGITANTQQCDVISEEELKQMVQQNSIYYAVEVYFELDEHTQKMIPYNWYGSGYLCSGV